ncbi:hypothetical protein VP01_1488g1 [Puccinia sorghi]|uniref:Uncharacterized protein n=1 Tax=Puccinia sorghi TaxID=27349 RepID=A0A0L6VJL3_9BASI|nr:hypothetical protein VP01_1488g1 [Puccinia sorghi]
MESTFNQQHSNNYRLTKRVLLSQQTIQQHKLNINDNVLIKSNQLNSIKFAIGTVWPSNHHHIKDFVSLSFDHLINAAILPGQHSIGNIWPSTITSPFPSPTQFKSSSSKTSNHSTRNNRINHSNSSSSPAKLVSKLFHPINYQQPLLIHILINSLTMLSVASNFKYNRFANSSNFPSQGQNYTLTLVTHPFIHSSSLHSFFFFFLTMASSL